METTELDAPTLVDRCPFSRAFGPDFHDCVAFTQEEFTALDTGYRPLRPVLTCRHLAIGAESGGGFYPRCALGSAAARSAWANEVGPDRLSALRELSLEYRAWVSQLMPQVWESKGSLLSARASGRDAAAAADEMRERVDELLDSASDWIDDHGERLQALGLDPEILKSLAAAGTQAWIDSPSAGLGFQVPEHVLERFPSEIQVFIRAGR